MEAAGTKVIQGAGGAHSLREMDDITGMIEQKIMVVGQVSIPVSYAVSNCSDC